MTNYVHALSNGFPGVVFSAVGPGTIYENITWLSGAPLPSKTALEEWSGANITNEIEITKYEFRKLFTLNERIAVDSAPSNTSIPANYRAVLVTMNKDMELSSSVILSNPDVADGVNFLETLGLIAPGRAATILSNTVPN